MKLAWAMASKYTIVMLTIRAITMSKTWKDTLKNAFLVERVMFSQLMPSGSI